MNRIFRVVWNDALALWAVASELGRGHARSTATTQGVARLAATLLVAAASLPASAACTTDANTHAVNCTGADQAATVGSGLATPAGTAVLVTSGATVSTGNASAISLGDTASIVVQSGATVQNSAANGGASPYAGIGANTIEVNNNSTIAIEAGGAVIASGVGTTSEAINPVGSGNTITNNGTISSAHTAIWFQAGSGANTVVNTGSIVAGAGTNLTTVTVIGASGTMAVDFTNKGSLTGSLAFAGGSDALRWYTGGSITGNISGGAGADLLTLNSDNNANGTFAPLSLTGFETLVNNSGTWNFNAALAPAGITSTTVLGGTLILGADNSAYTGSMTVGSGGVLQSSAQFAPAAITDNGLVRFAQPDNATYAGLVSGTGGIEKTGAGTLTLTQDQAFTGTTTISAGVLQLGNGGTTGSVTGNIVDNATLVINRSDALTLPGTISGTGSLVKEGAGTTTLTAANSYSGGTALKQGRLNVGNSLALGSGALAMDDGTTLGFVADGLNLANAVVLTGNNDPVIDTGSFSATLSGNISGGGFITKLGSGTLTLSGINSHTGATDVAEGTLKAGATGTFSAASAHTVQSGATLDLAGFSQTVASLASSGTISLVGAVPGTSLTVNGAYVGDNGVLRLGTFLGDSTSVSDRLVLNGASASASGRTSVQITQLGGLGAPTAGNGIEVISALNGATTTAQTTKDAFTLAGGHVDAGAYEYRLYAADASGAGENWYLRSTTTAPAKPVAGTSGSSGSPAPVQVPAYRVEVPLLSALPSQVRQMDLAMIGNLHQRVGDDDVKAGGAASTGTGRRAWGRVIATDIDIRQQGTVSPYSNGSVKGFQAGTDLLATPNWRAGVYAGQLDGSVKVSGFASGIADLAVGSNDLRSQYLGAYGTWTADSGFYADAVLQAGRHRYTVEPMSAARSAGKGDSLMASIEVGQAFALGASGWKIEPQLQLIHQHLGLNDLAISGARVRQDSDDGWIARAGVRLKGEFATGLGTLQPYGRFNVYKASAGADVARFIGPAASTDITSRTGATVSELAGGLTLALNQTTSIYGEIGKLWASGGATDVKTSVQGSLGLRMKW
ncbi:autotransporter outer membrane beta-barrel domain-containing protein [Variovorax sp. MHTC-1]|uniref:autotransporter outer membrane beta-barrel domain-containing protein n=1 Tax=Variovorax sp. MHTC-1 TaxID=2495593 RepID=UPI000F899883|nr:autotransporter outer membrane beta-barrel domain-containing protein [Variovorax sp. MHTC-1]RST51861.1 autotransporter outer membrane beta-barrel domain-containing protein [Variovorax sp. MHTC-1]